MTARQQLADLIESYRNNGYKIKAVWMARVGTGCGLVEAKNIVESKDVYRALDGWEVDLTNPDLTDYL